jgi:hypothetical protein
MVHRGNDDAAFYWRQRDASFRPVHDGYARFGNWPDGGGSEILAEEPGPAETVGRPPGSHDFPEQREAPPQSVTASPEHQGRAIKLSSASTLEASVACVTAAPAEALPAPGSSAVHPSNAFAPSPV